ncbi:ATP-binding protein [Pandoraea apista]|uniref:histidine kinase n=1 Tax=Pandoraea apista TaxID=93218 RepID=A0A0B5F224_9BURK|nr:ATP-binding protein [Pandoraea apista]AJE97405.1 membrane protein [Pandoraea apista]AKH71377.1 membrane protein [Pandoraea apista]AKI63650.1 membrane protein [Pandoraea apista]ALS67250.1 two-component sensor histidine kinase [Pandoraea apista]AVF42030.1 HAMP domain-containing protein [Pandoraea apista]
MKGRFDTLFGRLALLIIAALVISHFSYLTILRSDHDDTRVQNAAEQMAFIIKSASEVHEGNSTLTLPDLVQVVPVSFAHGDVFEPTSKNARLTTELARRLPAGTQLRVERTPPPRIWARLPGRDYWIATPVLSVRNPPGTATILPGLAAVLGITVIFALFAAWQLQRPVRDMAAAAEQLATHRVRTQVKERGPLELRQLTERFNRMSHDIVQTDRERNTMLAGIAHDLKTPLARLRLRAEMLDDVQMSEGITRDAESMTRIVDQFLLFARGVEMDGAASPVEARIPSLIAPFLDQGYAIELDLQAGPGFRLRQTYLERIVNNLLDNAVTYGRAPLAIRTSRDASGWRLVIEDSGPGIPNEDINRIVRPFVRLDPARGGNAHCGLGLAIVDKLTQQLGGRVSFTNRPTGGLQVTLMFPPDDPGAE